MAEMHHPEDRELRGFLYLILHGIESRAVERGFVTQDIDFFLGPQLPGHGSPRALALD